MSLNRDQDAELLVIGGGAAGLAAARTATAAGRRTVMIVDGPVGGDCTFTGCVPSKTLLETAARGLEFPAAMVRVRENIARIAATESVEVLESEGIRVIRGHASFDDTSHETTRVRIDGGIYSAQRVVLATGSAPVVPQVLSGVNPLTSDTFWSLSALPVSVAVVGGGALGCEFAQALARFGSRVTVIEAADRLVPAEEAEASDLVRTALEQDGVTVLTGAEVTRAEPGRLALSSGGTVASEVVLAATGRRPDTTTLDLPAAGIDVDVRGFIRTDDQLRTTCAGVYAVGDVTGRLPFTHAADAMGRVAGRNAFARVGRRFEAGAIPWVMFTDPEVARVGLREDQAAEVGGRVAYLPLSEVDRAILADRTDGFVKIIAGPRDGVGRIGGGKVLGATIVAPRAGEMIGELALAMRTGMFTGRLAQTVHAYPTYSIAIQKAAAQFFTTIGGRTARPARP